MYIQLNKQLCVPESSILGMSLIAGRMEGKDQPITVFKLKGHLETVEVAGDWVQKIVKAKKVGAVYLTKTHIELRS